MRSTLILGISSLLASETFLQLQVSMLLFLDFGFLRFQLYSLLVVGSVQSFIFLGPSGDLGWGLPGKDSGGAIVPSRSSSHCLLRSWRLQRSIKELNIRRVWASLSQFFIFSARASLNSSVSLSRSNLCRFELLVSLLASSLGNWFLSLLLVLEATLFLRLVFYIYYRRVIVLSLRGAKAFIYFIINHTKAYTFSIYFIKPKSEYYFRLNPLTSFLTSFRIKHDQISTHAFIFFHLLQSLI